MQGPGSAGGTPGQGWRGALGQGWTGYHLQTKTKAGTKPIIGVLDNHCSGSSGTPPVALAISRFYVTVANSCDGYCPPGEGAFGVSGLKTWVTISSSSRYLNLHKPASQTGGVCDIECIANTHCRCMLFLVDLWLPDCMSA